MSSLFPEIIDKKIELEIEDIDEGNVNEEEVEAEEVVELEVKEKIKIDNNEIFHTPVVAPVKKKKRVMSEAQKEALAKARVKANAKRTANKEARLKEKEELNNHLKQERDNVIKQKQNEYINEKVSKMKKVIDENETQVVINNNSVSLEDIERITSSAISKYDKNRREEKEKRMKDRAEKMKHKKINDTIKRAQGKTLSPQDIGYFDSCFGD